MTRADAQRLYAEENDMSLEEVQKIDDYESDADIIERQQQFLRLVTNSIPDMPETDINILVVSHASFIKRFLFKFCGLGREDLADGIPNCSVTVVSIEFWDDENDNRQYNCEIVDGPRNRF